MENIDAFNDLVAAPPTARIDEPAPEFTARTTMGERSLSDYRGRWLILFSHPADFTPVCTSEFIAFEREADKFRRAGAELLGLSVDSIYAHLAWLRSIEERFGVRVSFPIIEDLSLAVAQAYGMIHALSPGTATVRSVFFIDPEGIVRAMIHYPHNVGRSVEEILRVLHALQATRERSSAAPEGWRPGERMLAAPPTTQSGLDQAVGRLNGGGGDWYYLEERHEPG